MAVQEPPRSRLDLQTGQSLTQPDLSLERLVGRSVEGLPILLGENQLNERVRFQLSSAVFIILTRGPEICMLRRKTTGWMDGSFSIPAGGLEAGETIRLAAAREAYEEIGITIAPETLQPVHTLHSLTAGNQWLGHFFRAEHLPYANRTSMPIWNGELWTICQRLPFRTFGKHSSAPPEANSIQNMDGSEIPERSPPIDGPLS